MHCIRPAPERWERFQLLGRTGEQRSPGRISTLSRVVGIWCGLSDKFVVAAIETIGHF